MSQILKCPNMRVVLSYWEALIEGSELRYESLLYFSSNGSYQPTQYSKNWLLPGKYAPAVSKIFDQTW